MKAGILASLLLALLCVSARADPAEIRVGGTGAVTELLHRVAAAFDKQTANKTAVVASLGTSGAIRALADSLLDVAVAGRALKPEEQARGLKVAVVVRTPFVFVTSHHNPNGLSAADLVKAYLDPGRAWSDGTPIRVILRPRSESDVMLMASLFPGLGEAMDKARQRPEIPVAATDQDNADVAERIPGSLVGMTLAQLVMEKRNLRVVPIDDRKPTNESLRDGNYPYSKLLHFITRAQPSEGVAAFFRFLDAEAGQVLFREAYVFPEPTR